MKKNILPYTIISLIFAFIFIRCTDEKTVSYGNFSISARSMSDNSHVTGGRYQLLDNNNNVVKTYTLDNGPIAITDVPRGFYTIKEVITPAGYVSHEKERKLTVNYDFFEHVFLYTRDGDHVVPESMKVKFYSTENGQYMGDYNAVRIGEYYWVDQNFSHFIPWGNDFENAYEMNQTRLDKYLQTIHIEPQYFQVNINTFEKYYGRYYSYPSVLYMNQYGQIHNEYNANVSGWRLPYAEDYRQLFAMCPFNLTADAHHSNLNERDVRFALGARAGDNPMAFDITPGNIVYKTYWFDTKHNTNKYKFR